MLYNNIHSPEEEIEMVTAIAKIIPVKGKESALETELRKMIGLTQNERGAVAYRLHKSSDGSGSFMFYEKFFDDEAWNFHISTPYFKEFAVNIEPLIASPVALELYEEIASIDR